MPAFTAWKTDNYKFVGKAFDFTYAEHINKLLSIMSEASAKSATYDLTGAGGYGELREYDGSNLNETGIQRGFNNVLRMKEFSLSVPVRYFEAQTDKFGETRKVGTKLGRSAAMSVYMHAMRMFAHAFDADYQGGDGKPWAASDHPVASKGSSGRTFVADPDAGTYSNLGTNALSVSAITAAQAAANRFVTPDGLPFLCEMDTLLVSPELEETAKKICGTTAALQPKLNPADNTNAANPVYGMQYIVIGGGNDGFKSGQWAVCDRRLMKDMVTLAYLTRPTVLQNELDNPLIDMYTAYAAFDLGWGDGRMIFFNNPN